MGDPSGKEHDGTCVMQVCGLETVVAEVIAYMVQCHHYHDEAAKDIYRVDTVR